MSSDALNKVVETLEKAKERLSKPKPGDEKNPGKKPWESMKAKGKIRGVAERLLSVANKLEEGGKPPNAMTMRQIKALMNELGAALDSYPAPKRAMKSVSMTPEEFTDHAASEIERAVEDQDVDRLEQIQASVESVAFQVDDAEVEKVRIDVFEDPAHQKSGDGDASDTFKAITEKINELAESIQSLKAKKPFPPPKPGADGKMPPKPEDEMDMADGKKTGKADDADAGKQDEVACPGCGAMNAKGATACKACGAKLSAKADAKKADDERPAWPSDMNSGRKLSEAENWGRVRKSVSDDDRSFGPDPDACRE